MNLDQLATSFPNGLHDAELHKYTVDYEKRSVQIDLKLWMGRPDQMEVYRPATIRLDSLYFWIVEPPDQISLVDNAHLNIDMGDVSSLEKAPSIRLPEVPQTAFKAWIYVYGWNAFIYVAAETARFEWTGPEENHGFKGLTTFTRGWERIGDDVVAEFGQREIVVRRSDTQDTYCVIIDDSAQGTARIVFNDAELSLWLNLKSISPEGVYCLAGGLGDPKDTFGIEQYAWVEIVLTPKAVLSFYGNSILLRRDFEI